MMHGLSPDLDLAVIRQRHRDLRRLAGNSVEFRARRGRHRFRSRFRRRE